MFVYFKFLVSLVVFCHVTFGVFDDDDYESNDIDDRNYLPQDVLRVDLSGYNPAPGATVIIRGDGLLPESTSTTTTSTVSTTSTTFVTTTAFSPEQSDRNATLSTRSNAGSWFTWFKISDISGEICKYLNIF